MKAPGRGVDFGYALDMGCESFYRRHMSETVFTSSADVMSGVPVFPGTRVPVRTLLDYLEAGESINHFLAGFPSVSRMQVIAFLERAAGLAVTDAA